MTTTVDTQVYASLYARIDAEVQLLKTQQHTTDINDNYLLAKYNRLLRYARDIDSMRLQTYENNKLTDFNKKLHLTDRDIKNILLGVEIQIDTWHNKIAREQQKKELEVAATKNKDVVDIENVPTHKKHEDFENEESIESLKSRLLSTKHDQLDQVQSTEIQNNYHESIQQELIDSLPSMVSSIKEQALQFQEMLKQDAVILKEATQNFETSHGKFDDVNTLLSKYQKEGRLGFWFYVRIIVMVLVAFLFLLIIIRLIPARH